MSEGVKRTVQLGSVAYTDPSGQIRRADKGTEVLVHSGHVDRFDAVNAVVSPKRVDEAPAPAQEAAKPEEPKRRPGRPRKADSED